MKNSNIKLNLISHLVQYFYVDNDDDENNNNYRSIVNLK
jgi:hypothetical protein